MNPESKSQKQKEALEKNQKEKHAKAQMSFLTITLAFSYLFNCKLSKSHNRRIAANSFQSTEFQCHLFQFSWIIIGSRDGFNHVLGLKATAD